MNYRPLLAGLFCCVLLASPSTYSQAINTATTQHHADIDPEAATGLSGIKRSHRTKTMAVTANPHATQAASEILAKGGSAVDAAIAAQLVLSLVEPQSSGIGGGAFLMHWNQHRQQLQLFDGRETAPADVNEDYFLTDQGQAMAFRDTLIGGYSVGTPGVMKMLQEAHHQHGKLAWSELFSAAIRLSEQGFEISPRLHGLLKRYNKLLNHPSSRDYFYLANGQAKPIGHVLTNPAYAHSLRLLAQEGSTVFYQGELAQTIVNAVSQDPIAKGKLSLTDMHAYRAVVRLPLCAPYLDHMVCTTPPPSSGATILQILGMLEQLPAPRPSAGSVDWTHRFAEASKLAFADRDAYVADPAFVSVPSSALINPRYVAQRAQLIDLHRAGPSATPGQPQPQLSRVSAASPEYPSTSHLSIVDAQGNTVSMTSSVQMAFGSGILAGGFLLNNQLTDFSFVPVDGQQQLIANRIQASKRPRSSMSPTIVFKDGQPLLVIGSPGGSRIIDYVARVIAYTVDNGVDIADAIASPNIVHMNRKLELEAGEFSTATIQKLQALGHEVVEKTLNSGLHGIWLSSEGFTSGADPRREGVADGQ